MPKTKFDEKLSAIVSAGRNAFMLQFQNDPQADNVSSEYIFAEISDHGLAKSDEGNVELIAEALWSTHLKQAAFANSVAKLSDAHGYWNEYSLYPFGDWQIEVENNDTRRGYWEWVAASIERDANDAPEQEDATETASINAEYSLHADEDQVRNFLRRRGHLAAEAPFEQALRAAVFAPDEPTENSGFRLSPPTFTSNGEKYTFAFQVVVENPQKLKEQAVKHFRSVWKDESWAPETFGDAIFEILTGSNNLPAPIEVGFELIDWNFSGDKPYSKTTHSPVEDAN